MAFPGAIDVVYDTIGKQETFEVGCRVLKARGTLVKAGVHGPTLLGGHAAVLQGDQLRRVERVRLRGGRRRAQARHRRTTSISCATGASISPGCSRTRSRSTRTGATRSSRSPTQDRSPARSRSRSTRGSRFRWARLATVGGSAAVGIGFSLRVATVGADPPPPPRGLPVVLPRPLGDGVLLELLWSSWRCALGVAEVSARA